MKKEILSTIEEMPEYLSTQHLVKLGIYPSINAAYQARIHGYSPPFVKLRHRILWSKKDLLAWIDSRRKL